MARRREDSGQGLVEFALVVPIFLVLLFGVVDFGRVIWARNSLENAAREGARYAIVHGGSASQTCAVGPSSGLFTVYPPSSSCPFPSPSKQSIYNAASAFAIAPGSGLTVKACYGAGCSGNTSIVGATNIRGTPVTVTATSTLNLIVPSLLHLPAFTVTGTSTMLINY